MRGPTGSARSIGSRIAALRFTGSVDQWTHSGRAEPAVRIGEGGGASDLSDPEFDEPAGVARLPPSPSPEPGPVKSLPSTTRTGPCGPDVLAMTGSPPSSLAMALAPTSSALAACTWLLDTCAVSLLPILPVLNPLEVNTSDTDAARPLMSVSLRTLALVLPGE